MLAFGDISHIGANFPGCDQGWSYYSAFPGEPSPVNIKRPDVADRIKEQQFLWPQRLAGVRPGSLPDGISE
jgi:hypothetical protein